MFYSYERISMKSKSYVCGALLFIFGIAAGLVYANADALQSALATANAQPHDHLGCHSHGSVTYHCH